jgi:hypothetical protein
MATVRAQDIQLDRNDLLISADGDLIIHMSDEVHIKHILLSEKGHYKHSAITGCAFVKMLNSPDTADAISGFLHTVKKQLLYDGFTAIKFKDSGNLATLKIDAIRDE